MGSARGCGSCPSAGGSGGLKCPGWGAGPPAAPPAHGTATTNSPVPPISKVLSHSLPPSPLLPGGIAPRCLHPWDPRAPRSSGDTPRGEGTAPAAPPPAPGEPPEQPHAQFTQFGWGQEGAEPHGAVFLHNQGSATPPRWFLRLAAPPGTAQAVLGTRQQGGEAAGGR